MFFVCQVQDPVFVGMTHEQSKRRRECDRSNQKLQLQLIIMIIIIIIIIIIYIFYQRWWVGDHFFVFR